MKKTVYKWLILTLLAAYAVGICCWAYTEEAAARCSGVEISFCNAPTVDSITERGLMAEINNFSPELVGKRIYAIDSRKLERHLARLDMLESVQCFFTTSGKLCVRAVPMIPEIRVFNGSHSYYINKDGKKINAKPEFFVNVPIVSGRFSPTFPAKDILPVVRFIQKDPLLRDLVTMIQANDRNNIILVPRFSGHVINIGDTTDLQYKRRSIAAAYRKILPYRGWQTYDTISVKYHGQIVATRRNKAIPLHGAVYHEDIDLEEATLEGLDTDAPHKLKPDSKTPPESNE